MSIALRGLAKHKLSEDLVVPRSHIPEMIDRCKALGQALGLTVATYGHAGEETSTRTSSSSRRTSDRRWTRRCGRWRWWPSSSGGTITGEHGIGVAKKELLPLEQGPAVLALQRKLKQVFDPEGLLNPGKFLPD